MKVVILVFYITLYVINFNLPEFPLKKITNSRIYKFIYKYSYYGLLVPIKNYNYDYSFSKYISHILIFAGSSSIIYYATIENLKYSVIIFMIIVVVLPYLYLLNCRTNYQLFIEQNCFDYATNVVIFLKDNLVVSDLLLNTCNNIDDPLKTDLLSLIKYVNNTNNFNHGLDLIESKYQYSFIKNINILLKNAYNKGSNNQALFEYTFDSIENYQLQLNSYRGKKNANRKIFYFIVYLDLLGVLMLMKMFTGSTFTITNLDNFSIIIFLFYLLNILSIIYYEKYCYKIFTIEKGVRR